MSMKLKLKDLPKDGVASIRINSDIKARLKKDGISLQKLLDGAIERILNRGIKSAGKKSK